MKKWLLAWVVFTAYLIINMTVMHTAEQPHLAATLLLGFFYYLIFGMRGVYGAIGIVTAIVLLAVIVHQFRHTHYELSHYANMLFRLGLDLVTILGGGGLGYWVNRLVFRKSA